MADGNVGESLRLEEGFRSEVLGGLGDAGQHNAKANLP
jgi:hypothetical protein